MKTINLIKSTCILGLALTLGLASCKKDKDDVPAPTKPNENEVITTLKLVVSENDKLVGEFTWKDMDGDGPNLPSKIDTVRLEANKTYKASILLLDETKTPADTISNEVKEEDDEHQFFFKNTSSLDLTYDYLDKDKNDVPLGLEINISTKSANRGGMNIILKHQPGAKPTTGKGDETKGSTDINITLPVIVSSAKLVVEAK